jgi:SAM-dependent methyltransferase
MTELFGDASEYDKMLDQGIRLSGEGKAFFIEGRLAFLRSLLPASFPVRSILDFGCGAGETSERLSARFGGAHVIGQDVSGDIISHANQRYRGDSALSFTDALDAIEPGSIDLCYSNGAFHHIPPAERAGVVSQLLTLTRPGGVVAVFENNPWNPGTRAVMRRIPFDKDAVPVFSPVLKKLLEQGGFAVAPARYLFVFPAFLRLLRPAERCLTRVPAGAQYVILARRPA